MGWAAGVERLVNLVEEIHGECLSSLPWADADSSLIQVIAMRDHADEVDEADDVCSQQELSKMIVQGLRHRGYLVGSLTKGSSRRQLKNANQSGAAAVVLVHQEEKEEEEEGDGTPIVTVRNMKNGEQFELGALPETGAMLDALDSTLEARTSASKQL